MSFSTPPARLPLEATANSEVIQEILYALVRRGRGEEGVTLARQVAALFPDLLPVTGEDMRRACDLVQRYPTLSVRDAVHAATMLGNGLQQVISVNEDFDRVGSTNSGTDSSGNSGTTGRGRRR